MAIAEQQVVQRISGALDRGAGERELLDVVGQHVVDGGAHAVEAGVGHLDDLVASIVDDISVVTGAAAHEVGAGTTDQGVVARAAIERIGARATEQRIVAVAAEQRVAEVIGGEHVVRRVAGTERGIAGERQVLDVGAQRVVHAGEHRVVAFVGALDHRVAGVVHYVDIITGVADQRIRPCAAIQAVV